MSRCFGPRVLRLWMLVVPALLWLGWRCGPAAAQTHPGKVGIGLSLDERALGTYVDVTRHTWRYMLTDGSRDLNASEIDAQGYPTRDFKKIVMDVRPIPEWSGSIDDPQAYRVNVSGTYNCSFTGQATLAVTDAQAGTVLQNQAYDSPSNTTTFQVVLPAPGPHHGVLGIGFTNTKRTAASPTNTGITNLKVMQPGFPLSTTDPFKPAFFSALASANFPAIRFMDFTTTNNADPPYPNLTQWSQRKLPTDASQDSIPGKAGGACWEYVVQVGNRANKDIWINVPLSASTDYVTKLAQLIRYGSDGVNPYTSTQANPVHPPLNANLNVYVESSNEVWNSIFGQQAWNLAQANSLGLTEHQNHARRTIELKNTFASVFGAGAINGRVRVVLCSHAPMLEWWVQPMLDYISTNYGAPSSHLYMIARQGYFAPASIRTRDTVQQILDKARQDIDNQVAPDPTNNANRQQWIAKAQLYGLPGGCAFYEGGPHFPSGGGTMNLANQIAANRDPGMGDLLKYNYGAQWADLGGTIAMQFVLSSSYSRYGCWGLTDDVNNPDRNSKFQAIRDMVGGGGPPCTAIESHVDSIVVTTVSAGAGKKRGRATVTIKSNCGTPVANATVTGNFTGTINESNRSAVTNASGVAVVDTAGTASGNVSVTFCVTNVAHASLSYNASVNTETCDTN